MRDLRIIVIEGRLAPGETVDFGLQSDKTKAAKGFSMRASLLAAYMGQATNPPFVAACRAWIIACAQLGWKASVEVSE